ncbi:MAG TPA: hypoxanthine phosphoribosyltransferase [Candidatus Latescibacteria bacterium]|nr:hypoxanthine phosphoribosyltransferase [Candidatus Latescibacterota bacterium]HOF60053.1 hypoxanthine phosphoribosyltransferase [Candidatus Latescibacterota bacterium]HOS63336.1 hypoxanthine phosphoribosyltransferase [Candidatus Latescibacterota bacterium]HOT37833.1 hypoxanthine phosphoribosyltransferase [Candidatus Latescibacterota bacterium]HPC43916.1 hypoxanthine phosphoribosyltransferase [Candidatus Latescibacterota bacterium]
MSSRDSRLPEVLIPAEDIARRVTELGRKLSADYATVDVGNAGAEELVVLGVLKGAFMFLADLVRAVSIPIVVDFVRAASYGSGRVSSGDVRIEPIAWPYGEGRDVLVVEDVLDTGKTLDAVVRALEGFRPRSVKTLALLRKPEAKWPVDYVGFEIEDRFVVGYGLDDAGKWRQLPYIGVPRDGGERR